MTFPIKPYAKRGLYERFQRTADRLEWNPNQGRLLLGLSGGRDSVTLLHLLLVHGYQVTTAHLNHCLRGKESGRDEAFVRDLCRAWKVPLVVERVPVAFYAKKHHLSIEEAARIARYRFFLKVARKKKIRKILVAHHELDQAETVLLKLFRGCPLSQIQGMVMERPIPILSWNKKRARQTLKNRPLLIRPLLETPLEEIKTYAQQNRLEFREDSSNRDIRIPRNWIRIRLLPLISKRLNRNIVKVLARSAS